MKIVVDVGELRKKINKSIISYEDEYGKAVELYLEKSELYLSYLRKYAKDPKERLKMPPSLPTWRRDEFLTTLVALNVHRKVLVEMEHSEYNDIMRGLESLVTYTSAEVNALIGYLV